MNRPALTQAEQAVYDVLRIELEAGNLPPTYQTILIGLGLRSKSQVFEIVQRLETKGYITRRKAARRSIVLAPGPGSITIQLSPDLTMQLVAFIAPWGATADDVIAKALTEYLGRHA